MSEDGIPKFTKSRTENLTDGIFATVMTILVLSLVVPVVTSSNVESELASDLVKLLPDILTYIMSFLVLGVLWIGHHSILRFITRADRITQWINLGFLLSVGFVPFTTALLGKYPLEKISLLVYGVNLFAVAIIFTLFWFHALRVHKSTQTNVNTQYLKSMSKRILVGIFVYLAGILFAFVNPQISMGLYLVMPVYYIVTGIVYYE